MVINKAKEVSEFLIKLVERRIRTNKTVKERYREKISFIQQWFSDVNGVERKYLRETIEDDLEEMEEFLDRIESFDKIKIESLDYDSAWNLLALLNRTIIDYPMEVWMFAECPVCGGELEHSKEVRPSELNIEDHSHYILCTDCGAEFEITDFKTIEEDTKKND